MPVGPNNLPDLVAATRKSAAFSGRILTVDPGNTTGWALFTGTSLTECGQFPVSGDNLQVFDAFVTDKRPDVIVMENYRVYANRAAQHVGSEVETVQYVGIIKFLAGMYQVPLHLQMAHQAKGWVTDTRLEYLGLFQTGKRHANDAIRHGVYWLLFGKF